MMIISYLSQKYIPLELTLPYPSARQEMKNYSVGNKRYKLNFI